MSMIVLVFGQRLFHEHESARNLVGGSFMSMIVQLFGQRFPYEHDSASIWSYALLWAWKCIWSSARSWD